MARVHWLSSLGVQPGTHLIIDFNGYKNITITCTITNIVRLSITSRLFWQLPCFMMTILCLSSFLWNINLYHSQHYHQALLYHYIDVRNCGCWFSLNIIIVDRQTEQIYQEIIWGYYKTAPAAFQSNHNQQRKQVSQSIYHWLMIKNIL